MSQKLDLKEIERRVQHAAFQDGLTEFFMGCFLIVFGLLFRVNSTLAGFSVLLVFLIWPAYGYAKKRYIYPRIGYVKFGPEKEADPKGIVIAVIIFVVILLGALGLFLWIFGIERGPDLWLYYFLPISSGFMFAIGPYWLGETYGLKRSYVFAALFVLIGIALPLLGIGGYAAVGLNCLLLGLVTLPTGALMFTRFLRKYPPEEALDAAP